MEINKNRWSWQWERFKNEEKDIFLDWIYPTKLEDFRDKLVLDAGCGNGGHIKMVADYAKRVVGLDKYSADVARKNLKDYSNVEIIEGDIESFSYPEKFDAIYSVGVLHHLENPDKGFKNLVSNLKPGGFINIWVYAKEGNRFMINVVEPIKKIFLQKISFSSLRILAYFLTLILYIPAWSFYLFPLSLPYKEYLDKFRKHSFSRNLMNVFDKLNAPLTHWITYDKIVEWFKDFDDVKIRHYNGISWSAFGKKR
jgi:SAM-dependent methyltransferase